MAWAKGPVKGTGTAQCGQCQEFNNLAVVQ